MKTLANEGVFNGTGCGSGLLCPSESLNRWELAVWLVRIRDNENPPTLKGASRFRDIKTSQWQAPYVERFAELGITLGCSKNPPHFCPDAPRHTLPNGELHSTGIQTTSREKPAGFNDGNVHHAPSINALYAADITKGCSKQPAPILPTPRNYTSANGIPTAPDTLQHTTRARRPTTTQKNPHTRTVNSWIYPCS